MKSLCTASHPGTFEELKGHAAASGHLSMLSGGGGGGAVVGAFSAPLRWGHQQTARAARLRSLVKNFLFLKVIYVVGFFLLFFFKEISKQIMEKSRLQKKAKSPQILLSRNKEPYRFGPVSLSAWFHERGVRHACALVFLRESEPSALGPTLRCAAARGF